MVEENKLEGVNKEETLLDNQQSAIEEAKTTDTVVNEVSREQMQAILGQIEELKKQQEEQRQFYEDKIKHLQEDNQDKLGSIKAEIKKEFLNGDDLTAIKNKLAGIKPEIGGQIEFDTVKTLQNGRFFVQEIARIKTPGRGSQAIVGLLTCDFILKHNEFIDEFADYFLKKPHSLGMFAEKVAKILRSRGILHYKQLEHLSVNMLNELIVSAYGEEAYFEVYEALENYKSTLKQGE